MRDLKEKLAAIRKNIDLLRAQEAVVLELMGEEPRATRPEKARAPRSNVKQTVIDLLRQVGANGLNAGMAVAMAESEKGLKLERGTVSSLLSRMKAEGVVTYVDGLYRLPEHAARPADNSVASVHPLRASGGGS